MDPSWGASFVAVGDGAGGIHADIYSSALLSFILSFIHAHKSSHEYMPDQVYLISLNIHSFSYKANQNAAKEI